DLIYTEAHNDYLQILSETGVIGAGLLLLFGVLAVVKALRLIQGTHHRTLLGFRIGALTGCFGLSCPSSPVFNLQIPSNALLFSILAAISVSDLSDLSDFNRQLGAKVD